MEFITVSGIPDVRFSSAPLIKKLRNNPEMCVPGSTAAAFSSQDGNADIGIYAPIRKPIAALTIPEKPPSAP